MALADLRKLVADAATIWEQRTGDSALKRDIESAWDVHDVATQSGGHVWHSRSNDVGK